MSSHRIEITFAGDAPDSELERAKILGSEKVSEAIKELQAILASLGLDVTATAHSVRKMMNKGRNPAPPPTGFERALIPGAAADRSAAE